VRVDNPASPLGFGAVARDVLPLISMPGRAPFDTGWGILGARLVGLLTVAHWFSGCVYGAPIRGTFENVPNAVMLGHSDSSRRGALCERDTPSRTDFTEELEAYRSGRRGHTEAPGKLTVAALRATGADKSRDLCLTRLEASWGTFLSAEWSTLSVQGSTVHAPEP
jgi:hypothetical protein